jgi:hypothetical protein
VVLVDCLVSEEVQLHRDVRISGPQCVLKPREKVLKQKQQPVSEDGGKVSTANLVFWIDN